MKEEYLDKEGRGEGRWGEGWGRVEQAMEFFRMAFQKFKMAKCYSRVHRLFRVLR